MKLLSRINVSAKLPVIMGTLSTVALVTMGVISYTNSRAILEENEGARLSAVAEGQRELLVGWRDTIEDEVVSQATSPTMRSAITDFIGAWTALPGNKNDTLQQSYIANNPNPADQRFNLDFSEDRTAYDRVHRRYQPYFRSVLQREDLADIYILDPDGNIVYSVAKQADFATSVTSQSALAGGLAQAFQGAAMARSEEVVFTDFSEYGPAGEELAGFLASQIRASNDGLLGVFAVRISPAQLASLARSGAGLGETGMAMAVGPDMRERFTSVEITSEDMLGGNIRSELVPRTLEGESGVADVIGPDGDPVFAAFISVDMFDTRWAVVVLQDEAEMFAKIIALRNSLLMQGIALMVAITVAGIFLARSISLPLVKVGSAMKRVSQAEYQIDVPETGRGDEIGVIANALDEFRKSLAAAEQASADARFKGAAFEGSSAALMVLDDTNSISFANVSARKLLERYRSELGDFAPEFDLDSLIGQNIETIHNMPKNRAGNSAARNVNLKLGEARLKLVFNGIDNDENVRIGTVIEWEDVTQSQLNDAVISAIETHQAKAEFSVDGALISSNNKFSKLAGSNINDLAGKSHDSIVSLLSEDEESAAISWKNLLAGESTFAKFRVNGGGASDGLLEGSFSPVMDSNGLPIRILLIGNDVTDAQNQIWQADATRAKMEKALAQVVDALRIGLKSLSDGDLTADINAAFSPEYEHLRKDFNDAVTKLRIAMSNIVQNAESIRGEATDISSAADDLARRTERQAATLEETASALDQLTTSVRSAAEGASQANLVVTNAKDSAESSSIVVAEAITAMGEIESSSEQISKIIRVIDDIAFQTNLLALNAGVEAARAGEAGRGFAVVASEVRALAQRSSEAAREINQLISGSSQQ
ncbi:MAG: methyl-accepting chemotaxis protein, partial [Halocynthiibacter sp.]